MKYTSSLFFILFFGYLNSYAQTVISPNIELNNSSQSHVLITHLGDQFIGNITAIRNDTIDFKLRSISTPSQFNLLDVSFLGVKGESIQMFQDELNLIKPNGSKRKIIPYPSNQLLYTSSALPYRGKGIYRNTMLFVNQVEIQPSEHFSFGVGSFIPALISFKIQGRYSLNELIHFGLAVHEHVILFDRQFVTHPYGIVTIGSHNKYVNLSFGYWVDDQRSSFSGRRTVNTSPSFSIGGSYTFDNNMRIYSETMIVIEEFQTYILPSLTFSKYKRRSMYELGVVVLPESGFPLLPLLTYNYAF